VHGASVEHGQVTEHLATGVDHRHREVTLDAHGLERLFPREQGGNPLRVIAHISLQDAFTYRAVQVVFEVVAESLAVPEHDGADARTAAGELGHKRVAGAHRRRRGTYQSPEEFVPRGRRGTFIDMAQDVAYHGVVAVSPHTIPPASVTGACATSSGCYRVTGRVDIAFHQRETTVK